MQLCNELRMNPGTGGGVSAYSRIMSIFMQQRFLNHYDQPSVRLDRDQSVYFARPDGRYHSWLLRCLSPALLSLPYGYYRELRKLHGVNLSPECNKSGSRFSFSHVTVIVTWPIHSWNFLFQNTVFLNANISFLAIQSIDNSSANPSRSPAQIASYLSVIASFGSILVGLLLAQPHRARPRETA
ncbi:hypothetical protein GYMLUDRAFT_35968 [Collybiopsis luxurians FD-317 M1]|nr:hypothetical protein GYMLUDRAFT_35968 [Collybiopsis luxurians FD-317 M1]